MPSKLFMYCVSVETGKTFVLNDAARNEAAAVAASPLQMPLEMKRTDLVFHQRMRIPLLYSTLFLRILCSVCFALFLLLFCYLCCSVAHRFAKLVGSDSSRDAL